MSGKKVSHNQYNQKCIEHQKGNVWTSDNEKCPNCIVFEPDILPKGKLPTLQSVLSYYFYLRINPDYYEKSVDNVSLDIMNYWISCNVYPQSRKWVQKQLKDHFLKFKYLKNYPKMKKKDTYWREYNIFVTNCSILFDIIGDSDKIKGPELLWE